MSHMQPIWSREDFAVENLTLNTTTVINVDLFALAALS